MAAAIKPRNGKREYDDEDVALALFLNASGKTMPAVAQILKVPLKTIKNWKYGPRGERVRT